MDDRLISEQLVRPGSGLGHTVVVKESTGSTNDDALALAAAGAAHGTVVVAERQTKGRGRLGRRWQSPAGNLFFSVILREGLEPEAVGLVMIAAGVAVARALIKNYSILAKLKWPNDVRAFGKKLCGILAEGGGQGQLDYVVLGIGLNVNMRSEDLPPPIKEIASSIAEETGKERPRAEVLGQVLDELELALADLARGDYETVLAQWMALDEIIGKQVRAETPAGIFRGQARGIRRDGALLVKDDESGRERAVVAGDVVIVEQG